MKTSAKPRRQTAQLEFLIYVAPDPAGRECAKVATEYWASGSIHAREISPSEGFQRVAWPPRGRCAVFSEEGIQPAHCAELVDALAAAGATQVSFIGKGPSSESDGFRNAITSAGTTTAAQRLH